MHKVAVAGAGHGGLVAAAKLAQAGYDVAVYEKKKEEDLGYDWEDRFTFDLLEKITGKKLPESAWRYRGDCAFLSPDYATKVVIRYDDKTRQKMAWRKALIRILIDYAKECGARFCFGSEITSPLIEGDRVTGFVANGQEVRSDLVIDACGVFSPLRRNLPGDFGIEKTPKHGDLFYGYRAYFNKIENTEETDVPFEVYLCHNGEQGLSWHLICDDCTDVLIGRVYPLTEEKVESELNNFRRRHPCTGEKVLHGGNYGIIPVRRPLTKMVANGYAAVGDSAFMTTPMNGMGIDLSLQAGLILAETVKKHGDASVESLWEYNRRFHVELGGATAKNEGLKNALLSMPKGGVDFLFKSAVIQASDLSGAGRNTSIGSLLGKFIRGMKRPKFFFTVIKGLIKGGKASKLYKKAPKNYSQAAIKKWDDKIRKQDILIPREA